MALFDEIFAKKDEAVNVPFDKDKVCIEIEDMLQEKHPKWTTLHSNDIGADLIIFRSVNVAEELRNVSNAFSNFSKVVHTVYQQLIYVFVMAPDEDPPLLKVDNQIIVVDNAKAVDRFIQRVERGDEHFRPKE